MWSQKDIFRFEPSLYPFQFVSPFLSRILSKRSVQSPPHPRSRMVTGRYITKPPTMCPWTFLLGFLISWMKHPLGDASLVRRACTYNQSQTGLSRGQVPWFGPGSGHTISIGQGCDLQGDTHLPRDRLTKGRIVLGANHQRILFVDMSSWQWPLVPVLFYVRVNTGSEEIPHWSYLGKIKIIADSSKNVLCFERACLTTDPLTLFYTRGLEIVVLHVMVSQPYRFSPWFFT